MLNNNVIPHSFDLFVCSNLTGFALHTCRIFRPLKSKNVSLCFGQICRWLKY